MRLPDPLAAYLRELLLELRLLPQALRDLPRELEARTKASRDFWAAHTGALWAMAVTVALLWLMVLAVFWLI